MARGLMFQRRQEHRRGRKKGKEALPFRFVHPVHMDQRRRERGCTLSTVSLAEWSMGFLCASTVSRTHTSRIRLEIRGATWHYLHLPRVRPNPARIQP